MCNEWKPFVNEKSGIKRQEPDVVRS